MTEHKSLAEALAAFQAECPTLPKDAINPHFRSKFTPLDTMVEHVAPLLSKHGLSWSAFPCFAPDGAPALRYVLRHTSGEVESDMMPLLLTKADPQGMGSAITYARRYSLAAVLNLVADDDDDGNAASRPRQQNGAQPTAAPTQQTERPASAKQRGLINARAAEHRMPAAVLANVILTAANGDPREFESEEHAEQWLKRQLDRLPARLVNPVLAGIESEATPA